MKEITTPSLGEGVASATVARWLKRPGERVRKDETLLELETDKASVEVSAETDGVLGQIVADAGETVEIGAVLGYLEAGEAP